MKQRFVTNSKWVLYEQGEQFPLSTSKPNRIRLPEFGTVMGYVEEQIFPLAIGVGELEIEISFPVEVYAEASCDVYIDPATIDQTQLRVVKDDFLSLDRPQRLSPEMEAIERRVRMNELRRDQQMAEFMERITNATNRTNDDDRSAEVVENPRTSKKPEKSGNPKSSKADAQGDGISENDGIQDAKASDAVPEESKS